MLEANDDINQRLSIPYFYLNNTSPLSSCRGVQPSYGLAHKPLHKIQYSTRQFNSPSSNAMFLNDLHESRSSQYRNEMLPYLPVTLMQHFGNKFDIAWDMIRGFKLNPFPMKTEQQNCFFFRKKMKFPGVYLGRFYYMLKYFQYPM